jgi:hypothetical protein
MKADCNERTEDISNRADEWRTTEAVFKEKHGYGTHLLGLTKTSPYLITGSKVQLFTPQ